MKKESKMFARKENIPLVSSRKNIQIDEQIE